MNLNSTTERLETEKIYGMLFYKSNVFILFYGYGIDARDTDHMHWLEQFVVHMNERIYMIQ